MVQTSNVIYLPPGVMATANGQPAAAITAPGIPFDKNFFEKVLPQAIGSFCNQVACTIPVVELRTIDGTTHYVNGISGVSEAWVALHTSVMDHEHPVQVFVPYQTIFRVEIHPEADGHSPRLGFVLTKRSVSGNPAAAAARPASASKPAQTTGHRTAGWTPEARANMAAKMTGRKHSDATKQVLREKALARYAALRAAQTP